jgi:adenosine deaminase
MVSPRRKQRKSGRISAGFRTYMCCYANQRIFERVAYEMMEDMKKDNVCYVETRFAPVFHTSKGLYHEDIVKAVLAGLEKGKNDFGVGYGLILCGMRNMKKHWKLLNSQLILRIRGLLVLILPVKKEDIPQKTYRCIPVYPKRKL